MIWHGIKIVENSYLPLRGAVVCDGAVMHGPGLRWVNTMPPCFFDVEAGDLVELPQRVIDGLVALLSAPPKVPDPPWMLPLSLRPLAPPSDDFRFRPEWGFGR